MTSTQTVLGRLAHTIDRVAGDPAQLAALRRAIGRAPLDLPQTWPIVLPVVHDAPWAEEAVHHALTLYAVHQQSTPVAMYQPGNSVGRAVGRLKARSDTGGPDRRLLAAASATTTAALAEHLRGLVTLLRGARIPLDYLRLTRDFLNWPDPVRAAAVRRRWSRDLYRIGDAYAEPADSTPPAQAPTS